MVEEIDKFKPPHQHRYTHPNFTDKVKRNEQAKKDGTYNPNNADDNPHAVPAPKDGWHY